MPTPIAFVQMGTVAVEEEGRRPSIEKKPIVMGDYNDSEPPAFERLPDEIIQQYVSCLVCLGPRAPPS